MRPYKDISPRMLATLAARLIAALVLVLLVGVRDPASATGSCTDGQICGLKNPEDMIRVPNSRWAILSRLARDTELAGSFSAVDLDRRTARPLEPKIARHPSAAYPECPGAPASLITHGLDVRMQQGEASELLAVNHGGRQSIEVFDIALSEDGPHLVWKGCVILPHDVSANAVAALPDGFAVTSFGSSGAQGDADLLAGKPAGFVVKWAPNKGWNRVSGSEFGGDNGIAASSDGSRLYVNNWSDGTLRVLSLHPGVAPLVIKLGDFHPDNLHWMPDGNLLIAGQTGKPIDIIDCTRNSKCAVGSTFAIVDPEAGRVQARWTVAATSTFAAASTALKYGANFWASSFRGDRIVRFTQD